jgi:hypothetical protein
VISDAGSTHEESPRHDCGVHPAGGMQRQLDFVGSSTDGRSEEHPSGEDDRRKSTVVR